MTKWQKGWTCHDDHPKYKKRICGVKTIVENVSPCGHSWSSFEKDLWLVSKNGQHKKGCTCSFCSKKKEKLLEKVNAIILSKKASG